MSLYDNFFFFFQADKNQAKFLGELPEELDAKEDTKNQPSPSPQDKDGTGASSDNNQIVSEDKPGCEDEAKEQNTSETDVSDVRSDSVAAQEQPDSETSTSNKDKDEQKDEPECRNGDGEKYTSGDDEPVAGKSPAITEDKPDSEDHDKSEGDGRASGATRESMPEQGKEKERPVIVG